MPSIKSLLFEAARTLEPSSDSAALDAEILLCLTIDKERSYLRTWPEKHLQPDQTARFWSKIKERQKGTPVAYITGTREFWSRDFVVTPDVLIPRPDTEVLIELSLKLAPDNKPVKIIDLGTGSGIIAITLASELPHAFVIATDSSMAALNIAKLNANKHHTDNIRFYQSDWFASVPTDKFNLIVSNPPYVSENDCHLRLGDVRFEPRTALCAGEHGLKDIKTIADTARTRLEPDGYLLIEHGYDQQVPVQSIFKDFHYENVQTVTDLSGHPRATYGQFNPH